MADKPENKLVTEKLFPVFSTRDPIKGIFPIPLEEVIRQIVQLDSSVVKFYKPGMTKFVMPDNRIFGVKKILSDTGMTVDRRGRELIIRQEATPSYIWLLGGLLAAVMIKGVHYPAERTFSLVQTNRSEAEIRELIESAKMNVIRGRFALGKMHPSQLRQGFI